MIVIINGYVFGGGMELVLVCDFWIVLIEVFMGLMEISLVIILGVGGI